MLQVYVAVSPTELPAEVTLPLLGLLRLEHRAERIYMNNCKQLTIRKPLWLKLLYLRRQIGCVGMNEAVFLPMACVQVTTTGPMSSNPVLQVYVAVSPIELPVDVTTPLLGLLGLRHTPIREEQAIAVSKEEKLQDPVELVELNIARRLQGGRGGDGKGRETGISPSEYYILS